MSANRLSSGRLRVYSVAIMTTCIATSEIVTADEAEPPQRWAPPDGVGAGTPGVLYFAPLEVVVEATIATLSDQLAEKKINAAWWQDGLVKTRLDCPPIDRQWSWSKATIEYDGRILPSQKVAVLTNDGEVQGAMLVATEPVPSVYEPGASAVFIELLFTAPRNRPGLTRHGRPYYVGVGGSLLKWAVRLSRRLGCGGRLKLDASPECVAWYARRGFVSLRVPPVEFEGVSYHPMELPLDAVHRVVAPPRFYQVA